MCRNHCTTIALYFQQEKAYRDYGHDMDNTDTLLECGLSFTCDFHKNKPFIGQGCVLDQKRQMKENGGLHRRLATVLVSDPDPLLHHGEMLWRNETPVCEVRSASYGHSLGGAVGLAMLENPHEPITNDFIDSGSWQIEIGNLRYPCQVSLKPWYDPANERIKA